MYYTQSEVVSILLHNFLIPDCFNTHRVTVETYFKCKSQHYFRRRVNVLRDHIKSELSSTARTELML
jgi:hypothetical protein